MRLLRIRAPTGAQIRTGVSLGWAAFARESPDSSGSTACLVVIAVSGVGDPTPRRRPRGYLARRNAFLSLRPRNDPASRATGAPWRDRCGRLLRRLAAAAGSQSVRHG